MFCSLQKGFRFVIFSGRFTIPAFAAYSMSKKACIAFSDALRLEMKKFDVNVITIEPGLYRRVIQKVSKTRAHPHPLRQIIPHQ
jgi:short-subunit dehydrogenase